MKLSYNRNILGMLALTISTAACAQQPKVKTITIINGDTTITEASLDEELARIEKDIHISISEDGKAEKQIIKKIVISDEKEGGSHSMAYAFSSGDEADTEVSAGEKGTETLIIKKRTGAADEKEKSMVTKHAEAGTGKAAKLNLNVEVKGTRLNVHISTGSREALALSVLDENGKQVFHDTQKEGGAYAKEIELGKKGTYFLNIIQNKRSTTEKVIVE